MRKRIVSVVFMVFLLVAALVYYRFIYKSYRVQDYSTETLSRYPETLDSIQTVKRNFKNVTTEEQGKRFTQLMTQRIFPYWYGTKWDFNGTSQKPNEGAIACGYFVTTTLRDIGVPIDRVALAQCASEKMITRLMAPTHIKRFSNTPITEFDKAMSKWGYGLYVVGLDNHTGFLWIDEKGNFFIHSSGVFPYRVVKDNLVESPILMRSKYRVVGKLSADKQLLQRWIVAVR